MKYRINEDTNIVLDVFKNKRKEQKLNLRISTKYLRYNKVVSIKREEIITIIENIENMLFRNKNIYFNNLERKVVLDNIIFRFINSENKVELKVILTETENYKIALDRSCIIAIYNYLTKSINSLNKIKNFDINRKYTYVKVSYIEKNNNKLYSYISEDDSVQVDDIVYVDMAGTKVLAVVKEKEVYYFEETPYPVLETKRIISIVTRKEDYKY